MMKNTEVMIISKCTLAGDVVDAWQAIGSDLAECAAASGCKTIHVDDLADAISNYFWSHKIDLIGITDVTKRYKAIKKAIRDNISYGRTVVHF